MDGVAELGQPDVSSPERLDECHLAPELVDRLLLHLVDGEEGARPGFGDAQPAQLERSLQLSNIGRVVVADTASLEARERHLADDLLERDLVAQKREIVVGPAGRRDPQPDLVAIEQGA